MLVSDFDFLLPGELIAQRPPEIRGTSRMLLLERKTGKTQDRSFADLPSLLQPGDLLVLNDSRVLPARLFATRSGLRTQAGSPRPEGVIEVLLTERLTAQADAEAGEEFAGQVWRALVKPAKKVGVGELLLFAAQPGEGPLLQAKVIAAGEFGERTLSFEPSDGFLEILERVGHLPLPPYIRRGQTEPNTAEDRERYQTVYSSPFLAGSKHSSTSDTEPGAPTPATPKKPGPEPSQAAGSAAAPTAGLHFTPPILAALETRGIETAKLTLHVGLGTFQPVRVERTEDIRLHAEPYTLGADTADVLNRAYREGRRIVAVGTTTTRTLEHLARRFEAQHGALSKQNPLQLEPHSGSTGLFLSPGPQGDSRFLLVGGLLTNFHLPQSTLLMLVSAFAGRERVLAAYAHAVGARYRFFSYGDCMLVL